MAPASAIVETVLGYCGTPYVHQGRLPGVGMDCPAPAILAARHHGLVAPDFDIQGYEREPDGETLQAFCDVHMERTTELLPATVLLCAFRQGRPRHLGVLVDATPGRMYWVHAESRAHREVMKSRLVFGSLAMRLVQAYRIPGVAY